MAYAPTRRTCWRKFWRTREEALLSSEQGRRESSLATHTARRDSVKAWRPAATHAVPICIFVLALFIYWFAIADRHIVFLYYHDMGSLYPDTSPFSVVTSSRYWMAGLVASGAVMVLYVVVNCVLGRLVDSYHTPDWWRVWALCAAALLIGIPLITMTVNQPTLRLANAVYAALATLVGLALALLPSSMAVERPGDLVWLALDGMALMLVLLSLVGLDQLGTWLAAGRAWIVWMMAVVFATGVAGLLLVTGLRIWRRTVMPNAGDLFLAALCVAYLLMPLVHHLFGTNGYFYISDSDNFFLGNIALQLLAWLVVGILAIGVTQLRRYLTARASTAGSSSA